MNEALFLPFLALLALGSTWARAEEPPRNAPYISMEVSASCFRVGDSIDVAIWMHDVTDSIIGGQYFVQYDATAVALLPGSNAVEPGDPALTQVYECSVAQQSGACTVVSGEIGYAVGVPSYPPGLFVNGTVRMAELHFTALRDICALQNAVTWWQHVPPTRLTLLPSGGLYLPLQGIPPPPTGGDMNCDYHVNLVDLQPFIAALLDPSAYQSTHPSCNYASADCNHDGLVDRRDILTFVDQLLAQ
jgi:hypothetical protein